MHGFIQKSRLVNYICVLRNCILVLETHFYQKRCTANKNNRQNHVSGSVQNPNDTQNCIH